MASKKKDVNPLHKKKPKGHKPAHQNTFAFQHNANSRKTKKILSSPNVGLCRRCTAKIEWRKKYRKYKPLTKPAVCQYCHKKEVKAAYHKACIPCAKSLDLCAFCCKKWKDIDDNAEDDGTSIHDEDEFEVEDDEDGSVENGMGQAAEQEDQEDQVRHFCLEVQAPFASAIINGIKTVETRTYEIPEELINQPISIVETVYPEDFPTERRLPKEVPFGSVGGPRSNWEGWEYGEAKLFPEMKITHAVTFKSCFKYEDEESFLKDSSRHGVGADSGFNVAGTSTMYGWEVETVTESPFANMPLPHMKRVLRSVFEVKARRTQPSVTETKPPLPPVPEVAPSTAGRDQNFHGRAPVVPISRK